MKATFWGSCLATMLAVGSLPTQAEDIDLFIQPTGPTNLPNVLILIDNTANWSRNVEGQPIFINEMKALEETFQNLDVNDDGSAKFRVGIMLFTESGGGNTGDDGGYVRAAIRDMKTHETDTAQQWREKYAALIASFDENADKSNGGKAGKTFSEAYQYFSGLTPYTGNKKVKTDYLGNTAGTLASQAVYALPGNAIVADGPGGTAKDGTPYVSPIDDDSCAPNYLIYISNGAAQDNSSDNTAATTRLATAAAAESIAGATTPITLTPSGSATNVADEWARFMGKSSKRIITYTIDVDRIGTGQGPGWTRLLKSIAGDTETSGGSPDADVPRYFSVTSGSGGASIQAAVEDIFTKIQARNSVFASVSLPVSVNTEGTYLNQVFIGMFRPDAQALPRWYGNLKQYKIARVGDTLRTVDAYDYTGTINQDTGFVDRCARSFWTPTSADTYWAFAYPNTAFLDTNQIDVCTTIPGSGESLTRLESAQSNRPDGNFVEKGAQGYVLRDNTSRTMRTCNGDCGTGLKVFSSANVSASELDIPPGQEAALLDWARGLDTKDEDGDSVTTAEMRPSAHGDIVHSRPVAIDFALPESDLLCPDPPASRDARCNRLVTVFYGGNDGVLRAVNGNRAALADGSLDSVWQTAGKEMWSFVPPEFFAKFKPLRDNDVEIDYEGSSASVTQPKPYGIDGPITAYRNGVDTTWIYASMRRGGRAVYAFDVSTIWDDPSGPTLKWKRGCIGTDCSSGLSEIGQTWSAPRVIKSAGYGGGLVPLVIMGGGYDACQDDDPATCSGSSLGRKIYVLDGDDGSLLRAFDTESQVVADVVMSANPSTGFVQWGYAVDMAGNIYRISGADANTPIGSTPPADWTITKIADLGCATPASCSAPRKFMFAPGVVNEGGSYVLLVGSGDREKPLRTWSSAYGQANYFFMLRDNPADPTWLQTETDSTRCNDEVMCLNSLTFIANGAANPTEADLTGKKGWYLGLNAHEQVVTTALTVFGTTTFSTHTPVPATGDLCTNALGTARVYNISYKNAGAQNGMVNRSAEISGGGLPPSPVAGMVRLDDGTLVPFLIGGDPDSPLQSLLPTGPSVGDQPKAITYWYIHK